MSQLVEHGGFRPIRSWVRVPDGIICWSSSSRLMANTGFSPVDVVRAPGFSPGGSRFESVGRQSVTLAQLVERLTFNQVVMGSSPICNTNYDARVV